MAIQKINSWNSSSKLWLHNFSLAGINSYFWAKFKKISLLIFGGNLFQQSLYPPCLTYQMLRQRLGFCFGLKLVLKKYYVSIRGGVTAIPHRGVPYWGENKHSWILCVCVCVSFEFFCRETVFARLETSHFIQVTTFFEVWGKIGIFLIVNKNVDQTC